MYLPAAQEENATEPEQASVLHPGVVATPQPRGHCLELGVYFSKLYFDSQGSGRWLSLAPSREAQG